MRIQEIPYQALSTNPTLLPKYSQHNSFGSSSSLEYDEQAVEWKEDETCVQLCIRMPGVRAKDVQVSMQKGVLFICGQYAGRSSCYESSRSSKRQRLSSREFDVDTQMVDIHRAIANVWHDTLILYAPKKRQSSRISLYDE